MYRIRATGEVVSQGEFRSRNKNTSFPSQWSVELVEELGLDPVFETPAPTVTRYQTAYKDGVEQVAGKWVWKWSISEMDDEAKAAKDEEAAKAVRADRDKRIAETDWIVIKNLELNQNVPGVWEVYRQELRDVPAQAGFPHEITWPSKPE
jgi:Phage tail assembly chaperone protein